MGCAWILLNGERGDKSRSILIPADCYFAVSLIQYLLSGAWKLSPAYTSDFYPAKAALAFEAGISGLRMRLAAIA